MVRNFQKIVGTVLVLVLLIVCVEGLTRYRVAGVSVFVPVAVLNQRHLIGEDDLREVKVSKHLLTESMLVEKEELIGRYVALNHTLYPGAAIDSLSLEREDVIIDMPLLLLGEGQSLFSFKADNIVSGGGSLAVGHYVDINFVYSSFREDPKADVLLHDVRVVGVRDRKGIETTVSKESAQVVLLAINTEYMASLLKADAIGSIVLSAKGMSADGVECSLNEAVVALLGT